MGDAAQGEPIQHEVFQKPHPVKPRMQTTETPKNYRRYPGGKELPNKIGVWYVQHSGKTLAGTVSPTWNFDDTAPDAEVITPGLNYGKESGAVGVSRHGNFLQWGFNATPSRMTAAGKRFFLNCIHYIRKFDGKAPLVRCIQSPRTFTSHPASKNKKLRELLYFDDALGDYRVDEELQNLEFESNRRIETLESLIELLNDERKAENARMLLRRYTDEKYNAYADWKQWFDAYRERIYFTDFDGYKFRIAPVGYFDK